jgi:hypothetical protein
MDLWEVSKSKAALSENTKTAADDEVAKTGVRRSLSDSARSRSYMEGMVNLVN